MSEFTLRIICHDSYLPKPPRYEDREMKMLRTFVKLSSCGLASRVLATYIFADKMFYEKLSLNKSQVFIQLKSRIRQQKVISKIESQSWKVEKKFRRVSSVLFIFMKNFGRISFHHLLNFYAPISDDFRDLVKICNLKQFFYFLSFKKIC